MTRIGVFPAGSLVRLADHCRDTDHSRALYQFGFGVALFAALLYSLHEAAGVRLTGYDLHVTVPAVLIPAPQVGGPAHVLTGNADFADLSLKVDQSSVAGHLFWQRELALTLSYVGLLPASLTALWCALQRQWLPAMLASVTTLGLTVWELLACLLERKTWIPELLQGVTVQGAELKSGPLWSEPGSFDILSYLLIYAAFLAGDAALASFKQWRLNRAQA